MKFLRSVKNIDASEKKSVVTIGNFDGVHVGHQAILQQVIARAKQLGVKSGVILFEPQPQEFFQADPPARILSLREKLTIIRELGLDFVFCLRFDEKLAHCSAPEFVNKFLVKGLNVQHIMIGEDFRFGHHRQGDFHFLVEQGLKYGFGVSAMHDVLVGDQRVSSTMIREVLHQGNIAYARKLLGHDFVLMGRVVLGHQRGKQLGFPTANISLRRKKNPIQGVFIVTVMGLENTALPAVANIGVRPTIAGNLAPVLEIYILDYGKQFYGKRIAVNFIQNIRDEKKFDSIDALRSQIEKDVMVARQYFKMREQHN